MPVYPANPTYRSGFYNNVRTNGVDDRVYSAQDIRMPYSAIFSNGVKPNENGVLGTDLQVQAISGMDIRVATGQGMFGGAFFLNQSVYTITLDTAGSSDRYDCIIVRSDDTELVRNTTIYVKSLASVPTANDLVRSDDINEYCLGYVFVEAFATSVSQENITDTRLNQNLCGVITGVYQQLDGASITAQWNSAFYNWFNDIKDDFVSHATLIHTYSGQTVSVTANQTRIAIGIPQFNMNLDTLVVMVEGRVFSEGIDYTIYSNGYVDFIIGFPVVGTKVYFQVYKSVDGSQAETVVSQVNTLINQMNVVNNKLQYDYICNGTNDNIQLSNLIQAFYDNADLQSTQQIEIKVRGNFGFSTWYGTGTSSDRYVLFIIGTSLVTRTKKVVLDFSNCSTLNITYSDAAKYYGLFYGNDIYLKNIRVKASGNGSVSTFLYGATINCENCDFNISGSGDVIGLESGSINAKYTNCNCICSSSAGHSYSSVIWNNQVLELNSCNLIAYRNTSASKVAYSIYAYNSSSYNERTILKVSNCNMPQVSKTGYTQDQPIQINDYNYYSLIGNSQWKSSSINGLTTGTETGTLIVSRPM